MCKTGTKWEQQEKVPPRVGTRWGRCLAPCLRADPQNRSVTATIVTARPGARAPLKNSFVQSMIDFTEIQWPVIWGPFILRKVSLTVVKTYFTIITHTHTHPNPANLKVSDFVLLKKKESLSQDSISVLASLHILRPLPPDPSLYTLLRPDPGALFLGPVPPAGFLPSFQSPQLTASSVRAGWHRAWPLLHLQCSARGTLCAY